MKKGILFVGIVLLLAVVSGCKTISELYGLEPADQGDFVALEEIKVEEASEETPPEVPAGEEGAEEEPAEEVPEEAAGEQAVEPKEATAAKVLLVKETDLVSLKPSVQDPDQDELTVTYTSPLDDQGSWQTKYGDAGEYTVSITASDGQLSTSQDVLIIVNKKEEAPTIDSFSPEDDSLQALEDSELEFSVEASDLNSDTLSYTWTVDGEGAGSGKDLTLPLDFDAAGEHTVMVAVNDGTSDVTREWKADVANVNRKPVLEAFEAITIKETEQVVLAPVAEDPDGDELDFKVDSDKFREEDGSFVWETTYDDAGTFTISLTASDGTYEVSQEVKVTIENVNRPPVIEDIVLG